MFVSVVMYVAGKLHCVRFDSYNLARTQESRELSEIAFCVLWSARLEGSVLNDVMSVSATDMTQSFYSITQTITSTKSFLPVCSSYCY
jgi:hypothetical protein